MDNPLRKEYNAVLFDVAATHILAGRSALNVGKLGTLVDELHRLLIKNCYNKHMNKLRAAPLLAILSHGA